MVVGNQLAAAKTTRGGTGKKRFSFGQRRIAESEGSIRKKGDGVSLKNAVFERESEGGRGVLKEEVGGEACNGLGWGGGG